MLRLVLAAMFLLPAHSWYDPQCCGGTDCQPVPADSLIELSEGRWRYLPTGNVFERTQVHPSRDGKFHVCIGNKAHDKGRSYCVYILQGA